MMTEEDDPSSFMFTIGNTERNIPELIVFGTHEQVLCNRASDMMEKIMREDGTVFKGGDTLSIGSRHPLQIVDVTYHPDVENYTPELLSYYKKHTYKLFQLLVPDHHGRYPGDPECERPYSLVPSFRAH